MKNKEVKTDSVWSQDGQVENAIKGGFMQWLLKKNSEVKSVFKKPLQDYTVVGTPMKAIENVWADGFATPYYYISTFGEHD